MTPARSYMQSRAIDPKVAHEVGVTLDGNDLVFPTGKRRPLSGDGPKFKHPKGRPLGLWWLQRSDMRTVLLCEGESDALAALTALRQTPEVVGLRNLPVAAVPGVGFPMERLVGELACGCKTPSSPTDCWCEPKPPRSALLAFDADPAGRSYMTKASIALVDAGIRPIPIHFPEGKDLAGWLVGMPEERRGEALASLLVDSEADAPTLEQLQARRRVAELRAEADRLEELAA